LEIIEQEMIEESSKKKKVDADKDFSFMNNTFQKLSLSEKPKILDIERQVIDAGN